MAISQPEWLTPLITAAGVGVGATVKAMVDRWRHRRKDQADTEQVEASAADKLVGTALKLLDQVQEELVLLREQLHQCRQERQVQDGVIDSLRLLVSELTQERDSLRDLLDQATRPAKVKPSKEGR